MYRLIVESLLGLRLEVDKLHLKPCLPVEWNGIKIHYRYRETVYHIEILQLHTENNEMHLSVDGIDQADKIIHLVDDRQEHWVEMKIPATNP